MSDDLLITRSDVGHQERSGTARIGRHEWLSVAVSSPALVMKDRFPDLGDDDVDYPAFGLLGKFGKPTLFWRDGVVIVRRVEDEYIPDLTVIAEQLGAVLANRDGTQR